MRPRPYVLAVRRFITAGRSQDRAMMAQRSAGRTLLACPPDPFILRIERFFAPVVRWLRRAR